MLIAERYTDVMNSEYLYNICAWISIFVRFWCVGLEWLETWKDRSDKILKLVVPSLESQESLPLLWNNASQGMKEELRE